MGSYRYVIRAWVDVEILLVIFFLLFVVKGYSGIASWLILALFLAAVKSMARLRRMR